MRLHLTVEGQTEETFVRDVICPHLGNYGISTDVRLVEVSRSHGKVYRGGVVKYGPVRRDVERWLREDRSPEVRFSTMLDLYALPQDFPGFGKALHEHNPYDRVNCLENAFSGDIGDPRFIPYVQLHEFEALLFADVSQFDWAFIDHTKQIATLTQILSKFETPEHIDDGPTTAPSKRIAEIIPEYKGSKPFAGPLIAQKIGLDVLRDRCAHFGAWLGTLEGLAL